MAGVTRYHKVENLSRDVEEKLLHEGKYVRNYGRLNRWYMDELVRQNLRADDDPGRILERRRPWRLQRFLEDLIPQATFGYVSHRTYTLRVLNAGIEEALGKGKSSDQLAELLSPWSTIEQYWEGFQFHRELIGTSLINMLPDRPFALYVFAKDPVGDDNPIFYMELEINGATDRHVLVWELDQVMVHPRTQPRPHEASKASEYASGYQKTYFFLNWDKKKPRRIVRAVVADLPKQDYVSWEDWLVRMHKSSYLDAVVGIIILAVASYYAIWEFQSPLQSRDCSTIYDSDGQQFLNDRLGVMILAGIVVAGIAGEEWLPPWTLLMGAIARFHNNESLSLRVHYRFNNSVSVKRVLITLLASLSELGPYLSDLFDIPDYAYVCGPDAITVATSVILIVGLLQPAYTGIYGAFDHSDFPSAPTSFPKIYIAEEAQHFRQLLSDCSPVEEFCSVFRPLLHWQRGIHNRFLGDQIDLMAPGSPSSVLSLCLTKPATSRFVVGYTVYGDTFLRLWLLPLVIAEQLFAMFGGLIIIILDTPVAVMLLFTLFIKHSGFASRGTICKLNELALKIYYPADFVLQILESLLSLSAKYLKLVTMECRARPCARLYRFPMIRSVRTGRTSNHSWKFADYLPDAAYFRCKDIVIVNPCSNKLAMGAAGQMFYNRHILLWTAMGGQCFEGPVLSCGDNSVSRRESLEGQGQLASSNTFVNGKQQDLESSVSVAPYTPPLPTPFHPRI